MIESSEVEIASESEWSSHTPEAFYLLKKGLPKLLLTRHKTIGARHVMAGLIEEGADS